MSELLDICKRVRKNDFSYDDYRPLVKLVVQKAVDVEIWSSVLDLTAEISRVTPPPTSAHPVVENTPIRRTSQSQQGSSEQTRKKTDSIYFFKRFGTALIEMWKDFLKSISKGRDGRIVHKRFIDP